MGARGLMQLMLGTARELGVRKPERSAAAHSSQRQADVALELPEQATEVFGAAFDDSGPGNVRKYGRVPPFRETQTCVRNITANYYR